MPERVVTEDARLDVAIAALFPDVSRSRAASLVKDGAVRVDGAPASRPSQAVRVGARIDLELPPATAAEAVPQDLPLRIVFEDAHIVVVDKDAGMVVHPGAGHADGTLVNALLHHVDDLSGIGGVERPGIVHRLDKDTSGLLVVAKHDRAHQVLSRQFADHSAGRTYLAICLGIPAMVKGTLRSSLGRHPTDRLRFASVEGGKLAVTHWERLGVSGRIALIECRLETGRTHQVRVHLAEAGWPIVGDPLYFRGKLPASVAPLVHRTMLHARQLCLRHPETGEQLVFDAPIPTDFAAVLAALELSPADDRRRSPADATPAPTRTPRRG
jgi:23S rRNA pseudouridine1911/1915/1917 synthase